MDTLNEQQKNHLRHVLEAREQALREDIRREVNLQDDYMQLASEVPDPGDLSFANLSIDLGNAAVTRDMTELRATELARKKIALDAYGECIACGYPIPYERLLAMPAAERCAPCQEVYERTHQDGMKGASL
jgi:RNA polymerase-binding transcription factor DksA